MTRRRVVNGHVFIRTRRGWREVLNGYIRTRKGWRLMRRSDRRRKPAKTPEIAAATSATPPSHSQWPGKYAALRAPDHDNAVLQVSHDLEASSLDTFTRPRDLEATIKAGSGSYSVKTFETQARPEAAKPPGLASVPVS